LAAELPPSSILTSHSISYKLKIVKKDNYTQLLLYRKKKYVDSKTFSDSIASVSIVDSDNDGNDDIVVGIVKSSRWSEVKSLKMYLYKISQDRILPLWRSSKLTSNMIDFCFVKEAGKNYACVIEKPKNHSYNLIRFRWRNFGLIYENYIIKNQDSSAVFQRFSELRQNE
jgi:hypothetical protein